MAIIRSDTLTLQVTGADQQQALANTLALYRRLVRDLMTVAYTHWPTIGATQGNEAVKVIEALIHPTAKRPHVRYTYFAKRYYKFPSYLRRVALMDAVGQVRSFVTRFDQWRLRQPVCQAQHRCQPCLYQGALAE